MGERPRCSWRSGHGACQQVLSAQKLGIITLSAGFSQSGRPAGRLPLKYAGAADTVARRSGNSPEKPKRLNDKQDARQVRSIYKICSASAWREAERQGVYRGSAADLSDAFIYFFLPSPTAGGRLQYRAVV